MHFNIITTYKSCVFKNKKKVYVTFAFIFLTWAGLACFKKKKSSTFGKCKGPFTPKVKRINLRLKEMQIHDRAQLKL